MKEIKKRKEPYIKIPTHTLELGQIILCENFSTAYIYVFSVNDCRQSNGTLAESLMVSVPTISRGLERIKRLVYDRHPHGYSRTLWVRSHPDASEAIRSGANLVQIQPAKLIKSDKLALQNRTTNTIKSEILVNQRCAATKIL